MGREIHEDPDVAAMITDTTAALVNNCGWRFGMLAAFYNQTYVAAAYVTGIAFMVGGAWTSA